LKAVAEDINVVGSAVVNTPDEDNGKEQTTRPAVPEPNRAGQHGEDSIAVLDEHEGGLLKEVGKGEDDFTDPGFGVRLSQPSETGGPARGNLLATTHRDEEVIAQLPKGIRTSRPEHHLRKAIMVGRSRIGVTDVVDGGIVFLLVFWG